MSFLEVTHTNPGAVTKRLDRWNKIFGTNLIQETIEKQMDIAYEAIYKAAPVKTGYLRSTIKVTSGEGFASIAVTARYAWFVSEGYPKGRHRVANPYWTNTIAGLSMELILVVRNLFIGNF